MLRMKIDSLQNKKVKEWAKLNDKKIRDTSQLFLVEGEHLVKEAFLANSLKGVIYSEDYDYAFKGCETYIVSQDIMQKLSEQASIPKIIGVCAMPNKAIGGNKILFLDDVQDPGNVGTLLRSAVSFGFDAIMLSKKSADLYNEKVVRSSKGAIFHVPSLRCDTLKTLLQLKDKGYHIYGTSLNNATLLSSIKFVEPLVLVLGNEGNGMSEAALKICHDNIKVEMENFESLNVGIAGSICMYTINQYYK